MAGLDNTIIFSAGEKLQTSSPQDIARMQELSTDVSRINYVGNPNGFVSANPSSFCHDPVSGIVYIKMTGTGNTGWVAIPTNNIGVTSWIDVIDGALPTDMAADTGYFSNDPASDITFNLPASAPKYSIIQITNRQAAFNFTIAQASGQSVQFGDQVTTLGAGGSIQSNAIGDSLELICVVADTTWQVLTSFGNLIYV